MQTHIPADQTFGHSEIEANATDNNSESENHIKEEIYEKSDNLAMNATTCSVCEKTFKLAKFLRSHMKTHIPVDQRPFGCVECDSRFVTKQKLKSHFGRIHSQERPEVCHICGKAFPEKAPLHQHLRQHGLVPDLKCEVENCGESFKYSAQLRKHPFVEHFFTCLLSGIVRQITLCKIQ